MLDEKISCYNGCFWYYEDEFGGQCCHLNNLDLIKSSYDYPPIYDCECYMNSEKFISSLKYHGFI